MPVAEELELVPATKSRHGFLASRLSDNIYQRDDGSVIAVGCPIARTGWQTYTVRDLPQERAQELGVDLSNPSATIELYRPPNEVFHPEFLASLNGVPVTDGHPPDFVNKDNFSKYAKGHIQNVRKGAEPLESGDWPIIADVIISCEPLVSKVLNKTARDVSLGYDFGIDRDGDKIIQCNMMANHNAVVPAGRAGDLVSIADAAPTQVLKEATAIPEPEVVSRIAYPPIAITIPKEKHTVADKKKSWFRSLMGKHLIERARATDADPEEIMDMAEGMVEETGDDVEVPSNTQENEFKSAGDRRAKDGELPEALKEHQFKKGEDRRAAAHKALDALLDRTEGTEHEVPGKTTASTAKDADIEELKDLLNNYLDEEEKEPEHAEDEPEIDPTDLEEVLAEEDDVCPDCGEAHDAEEECASGEMNLAEDDEPNDPDTSDPDDDEDRGVEDRAKARDARVASKAQARDGAMATLRMLRPVVARTGDKAVQAAFNTALASVKKSSRPSTGSYGKFAASARARDGAPRNPNPDRKRAADGADPIAKMQAFYDTAHKGGK